MTRQLLSILTVGLLACGGSGPKAATPASPTAAAVAGEPDHASAEDGTAATDRPERAANDAGEFAINPADPSSRPAAAKLKATDSEAAVRFFVVDKDKGPIEGIVIALTSPTGEKYYADETDADGFTEVLLPIGQTYELVYLSLGRRDVAAKVKVANESRLNLKLTMRYQREDLPTAVDVPEPAPGVPAVSPPAPRFVLSGVQFDTAKATLTSDSFARLDTIVEYLTHKKSARIEISGHTDNVGKKADNKRLSQARAEAVRDYLVAKGIEASRITAVGYGDERPIAPNDTAEGRQRNRRIEAVEAL
jgi:outer membrane protein OmpA-like peptidoglycan-associated protein